MVQKTSLLNTAKLPPYWLSGQFAKVTLLLALECLPLVFAGAIFGVWLNRRISDRLFGTIVYVVTFVLGIYILFAGVHVLVYE